MSITTSNLGAVMRPTRLKNFIGQEHVVEQIQMMLKKKNFPSSILISGPTGCGKTTLINLLMRFYDVNSGEIRVSGTPIDEMTRKSLRSNYGMVLQETWLRSGTIRENITMGKPDATEEEIIAAAKASHAHSFIKRLPKGYDTVISEDGGSLSQGQKQLLCITRVMLCLPPMLILDEATSSIDTRTEIKIQEAFARMMKGRTSFIVAHRLSTIREADIILVMRDGNIVEQGKHEELLEKNGFYAKLYNSQFAK
jgi:ATP-binding cassette subfamily B protein